MLILDNDSVGQAVYCFRDITVPKFSVKYLTQNQFSYLYFCKMVLLKIMMQFNLCCMGTGN
jgi:hypothetical protein